jgi:arylsulfatase A-like enzyme
MDRCPGLGWKNHMLRCCSRLFTIIPCLAAWLVVSTISPAAPEKRPNLVVILADDLGIECLTTYGGKSQATPHIDKLRAQGMQFSHSFSNPFCSPSRASLLTGRYPFKNGLREVLHSKRQEDTFLSPEQPSFVRQLKAAGYATAIAGKWHVSLLHKHNTINEFGFDQYQVWQIFDDEGNKRRRFWTPHINRNGTLIADEIKNRYGPDLDMEFLLDFIRRQAEEKQPFFAYLTTCLPHYPWEPTPDSKEQGYVAPNTEHKGDPKFFPEMVAYLDKQVGRILKNLDDLGIAENTVVMFLADNGTDRDISNLWGDGKQIQGGKGTMTDRGTRVPLIVRLPGRIEAGSTCDDLVDFSDIFPTVCEITGAPLPEEELHGRSFLPQLAGEPGNPREWVHIQDKGQRAVRNREFILTHKGEFRPVTDLSSDPAPAIERELTEKEQAARKSLQAAFDELRD